MKQNIKNMLSMNKNEGKNWKERKNEVQYVKITYTNFLA